MVTKSGNGCQWMATIPSGCWWQSEGGWEQMRRWLDLVFACSPLQETVGSHQKSHCALHPQTNTITNTDTDTNTDMNINTNTH